MYFNITLLQLSVHMLHSPTWNYMFCPVALAAIVSQLLSTPTAGAADKPAADITALRDALTFYASFDHGPDADRGDGDRGLYSAPSLGERFDGRPGLPANGVVTIATGAGRFGDALRFHRAAPEVVFFKVARNLNYASSSWNGAVTFWLKLDPNEDLPPGYVDPLFITPRAFNDGALWTDFSDQPPRTFRHGAFPDRMVWDPQLRDFDKTPESERPLATVRQPPFARDEWTHIVFTFANFNTGKPDGVSTLYLNGRAAGTVSARTQTYTWDIERTTAVMGINYVGLFDELAFFNRTLTADEVRALYESSASLLAR